MQPAPYYEDVAGGPPGGAAYWLTASDDVRIRFGVWRTEADAKATLLIFPGRTEHVEKYGIVAKEYVARGYAVVAVDWRGQGLADRFQSNRLIGDVGRFPDYQKDVAAVLDAAAELDLPRPWVLLGHSMGGSIGLRALMEGFKPAAAVFTGPMWGIAMPGPLRALANVLTTVLPKVGLGGMRAPSTPKDNLVLTEPFEGNTLTNDPAMFAHMKMQLEAHHDLSLGGPSINWLGEALAEIEALDPKPAPDVPCLTFVGENERIADIPRQRARAARWPGARFELVDGAQHEVLFEVPKVREYLTAQIDAFFTSHIS
ncbi:alpha/beta hydrolase [Chachezhania antarctica]|uniref:alpha/beta hydrolase n=1 Tax=Chachezhania antarctica TaxID=2340860 RepID=UPI000EB04786|nr:alpha/beta hydrolase [Chachezhania antarctica]